MRGVRPIAMIRNLKPPPETARLVAHVSVGGARGFHSRHWTGRYLSSISELHCQDESDGSYSSHTALPSSAVLPGTVRINSMPHRSLSNWPKVIEATLPLA